MCHTHAVSRPEKVQAALRLMGNPYASLSLIDDEEEVVAAEPSFEQKRAYFKKLENPQAFSAIFGDSEDNLWQSAAKRQENDALVLLGNELDEVLHLYKPYIARNEWVQLMDFKTVFLNQAGETPERAARVTNRLQRFKFSLRPGEKVEYNRAPAARIISELEKILD
jgi:hypothetical protein